MQQVVETLVPIKHLDSRMCQGMQSFTLGLRMKEQWFATREGRARWDEELIRCDVERKLQHPNGQGTLRYTGIIWARASLRDDKAELESGKIPAGLSLFEEAGRVVRAPIINLEKLNHVNEIEAFSIEIHPEMGNFVSFRHAIGRPVLYMTMQPEHALLDRVRMTRNRTWG